jgi:transposase
MEREQLERYLGAGTSLDSMAEATNRHPSTVSYWLHKHGLRANGAEKHAPRAGISKRDLRPLVEAGLTAREISARLDRSQSNVRYWIERHGLPSPISVRNRLRKQKIAAGERTLELRCSQHGATTFVIENGGRARCRKCRQDRVARWRRSVKLTLVEEAGGSCAICGYDRYPRALQFHHLDPAEKSFGLSARGITRSLDELRMEAAKCVLLCANCHAEVEGGLTELPVRYRPESA